MARKSRKAKNIPLQPKEKIYKAAVYYRLSKEDNGTDNKDTIEHQAMIVENYLSSCIDIEVVKKYIENGKTGTNFERPKFQEMMEDVKANKIDCIVVKDLSRFGRNHVETSNYIERIFPFFNIRFISIAENFDTLTAKRSKAGYIIPLKALLDELYAKDLSKKIVPVLRKKQEEGYYIGNACYGYLKSPENKGKLIIDKITAPVVKEIFNMRLQGMGYMPIAKELNARNILCPQRYFYESGIIHLKKAPKTKWADANVKDILRREVYLGHMVQGRYRQNLAKGQSVEILSDDKLIRVYNTHEPIIDEAIFNRVQQINEAARKKYYESVKEKYTENKYLRKIYCANCNTPLRREKDNRGKVDYYRYYCISKYQAENDKVCDSTIIREDKLDEIVLSVIKSHIKVLVDTNRLLERLKRSASYKDDVDYLKHDMTKSLKRKERNNLLRTSLYEKYILQDITINEYYSMKNEYEKREEIINKDIEGIQSKLSRLKKCDSSVERIKKAIKKFSRSKKLTKEMIQIFINRIGFSNEDNITIKLNFIDEIKEVSNLAKEMAVVS